MTKIWLSRKNIEDIHSVLSNFPEIERFEVHEHSQSGIGSCLDMTFDSEVNGTKCKVTIPISDESTW